LVVGTMNDRTMQVKAVRLLVAEDQSAWIAVRDISMCGS
jgi:hypothetical protein